MQRQITAAIALGSELPSVLSRITRTAARVCGADMAAIALLRDGRDDLEVAGAFGVQGPLVGMRLPVAASLNGLVITSRHSVRSTDVLRDPRRMVREIPQLEGARGVLAVPVRNAAGGFGTLAVAKRTPWRFTTRDVSLLTQLADNASIAVQNADLRGQLEKALLRATEPDTGTLTNPPAFPVGCAIEAAESRPSRRGDPYHLSPRVFSCADFWPEREIVNLVAAGMTCKEAAATLHISDRTVQHYLERMKLRFDQPRLPALVAYVTRSLSQDL